MKNICNGALFLVKLHNWTCNLLKQLFYCKYFPVNINQISQKSFLTPLETYSGLLYNTSGKQFWLTASVTTIRKVIIFSFSKFLLYSTCKTETVWSRKFHRNPLATESSFFLGWQFLNLPYAENPDIIAEIKPTEKLGESFISLPPHSFPWCVGQPKFLHSQSGPDIFLPGS